MKAKLLSCKGWLTEEPLTAKPLPLTRHMIPRTDFQPYFKEACAESMQANMKNRNAWGT